MKKIVTICLFSFATLCGLTAQEILPNKLTEAEARKAWAYYNPPADPEKNFIPQPPPGPVRTMGEWEEIQALVLTWTDYVDILVEITRHAVEETKVIIIASNPTNVINRLNAESISLDSVTVVQRSTNSIWIRDYGPWTIYQNEVDSLMIADWTYNRPRPQDDTSPSAVANFLGLPIFEATTAPYNLVHTGGNHLTDGVNTAFSSDLLFDENPDKTEAEIDNIVQLYLGVDNYVKFRSLPYDGIHHLDMHIRLLDEETIMFGAYPEGVADGPQIASNIRQLLSQETTAFGNRYRILDIPMPPDQLDRYPDDGGYYRTYTNSIFLNKTILVPTYEEQYDTTALRLYRENLPGYNVVGINCNQIIPALGALHCITKTVGVNDPLWIAHARLRDTYDAENDYAVTAKIRHRSGISGATLYYRTEEGAPYTAVDMSLTNGAESIWSAAIPAQPAGTEIQYYIHGTAHSGKQQVRPIVAPEGYFRFRVKAADAPIAKATYDLERTCVDQNIQFFDLTESPVETRLWSFPGGDPATSSEANPMVHYSNSGTYTFSLSVSNAAGSNIATYTDALVAESGALPFYENFQTNNWVVENPGEDGAYWRSVNTNCSGASFRMDNFSFNTRNTDDFLRSAIDLRNVSGPTEFSFDVAYASRSSTVTDILRLNVLRCDGERIPVYTKYGAALATAPATNSAFIPASCDQWRHETVDISAFAGEIITLEFENIGGSGNRVYVDNLDFSGQGVPNLAPFITLSEPVSGTFEVEILPELPLLAIAGDPDGTVDSVAFLVNGVVVATLFEAPYQFTYPIPAYGTYTFTARATDNDGAATLSSLAVVNYQMPVGVQEARERIGLLRVFPNPAKGQATLELQSRENALLTYRLLDVNGREIQRSSWETTAGINTRSLDLSRLPAGIYCVLLGGAEGVVAKKLVVE
ncbi:MAG: agmatine deiminase family protein [Saprospiraceae bacterium]